MLTMKALSGFYLSPLVQSSTIFLSAILSLPYLSLGATVKNKDGYCVSCKVNAFSGFTDACGESIMNAYTDCLSYFNNNCPPTQIPEEDYTKISTDLLSGKRVCLGQGGCYHACVKMSSSFTEANIDFCCLKPGSSTQDKLYDGTFDPKSGGGGGGNQPEKPAEGKGIGISCDLVDKASDAYTTAKKSNTASSDNGSATLEFYAQALHMACLRSSPRCKISQCDEVSQVRKSVPPGCEDDSDAYRGGDFEESIFKSLVNQRDFADVEARNRRYQKTIQDLVKEVESGQTGSPFLNLMLNLQDPKGNSETASTLVRKYYSTIAAFEDLQPLFEEYIKTKVSASSDSVSTLTTTANDLTRKHSQLVRCAIAPSYATEALQKAIPPANAATASFFVPLMAQQLRNNALAKALLTKRVNGAIALARIMNAQLPVSPDLQGDTRNWIYKMSTLNGSSEGLSIPGQTFDKDELSDEIGSDFVIQRDLYEVMKITVKDRLAKKPLSDQMALAGLFFPTKNGQQSRKPTALALPAQNNTDAMKKLIKIVGPVSVIFPAASSLISDYNFPANITNTRNSTNAPSENFPPGSNAGGALTPQVPTDTETGLLYTDATLRIAIDPVHFMDANPKIDPATQLYIIDLVSGMELQSSYEMVSKGGKDGQGKEMEFGALTTNLEFGKGVWSGGWGGGGAFAVAVRSSWVEIESSAVRRGSTVGLMWVMAGFVVGFYLVV